MLKINYSYPTRVYFGVGSAKEAFRAELDILAIGGGSVIDCSKVIAAQAMLPVPVRK